VWLSDESDDDEDDSSARMSEVRGLAFTEASFSGLVT
jgi:hypothetical protein